MASLIQRISRLVALLLLLFVADVQQVLLAFAFVAPGTIAVTTTSHHVGSGLDFLSDSNQGELNENERAGAPSSLREVNMINRRSLLIAGAGAVSAFSPLLRTFSSSDTVWASDGSESTPLGNNLGINYLQADSAMLDLGLLESRVASNVINPPPYGMEGTDVFYPGWFAGTWNVKSETIDVQAPCGMALFGGNVTFANAKKEIGTSLAYSTRFIPNSSAGDNRVVADREYNVKSIAKVSMGENSVVDVAMATPNKFSCLLAPKGAPSMLTVDLIVLGRRQENLAENEFHCSEVVREIVSPVTDKTKDRNDNSPQLLQQQGRKVILKEIETISLYTYDPIKDEVRCQQRSATFLLPSNESPMAMRMWQASGGKAIDVRFYDVRYSRRS